MEAKPKDCSPFLPSLVLPTSSGKGTEQLTDGGKSTTESSETAAVEKRLAFERPGNETNGPEGVRTRRTMI